MFLKDVSGVPYWIYPLILLAVCVIGLIILSCRKRHPQKSSISSTSASSTPPLKQHADGTVYQNVHDQAVGASPAYYSGYFGNSPGCYESDRQAYAALRQNETVYYSRCGRSNFPANAVNANHQKGGYGIVRPEELLEALRVRRSDEQNESSLGVRRFQGSSRSVGQTRPSEYDF